MLTNAPEARESRATLALERMASAENYNAWLLDRARDYLGERVLDAGAGLGTLTDRLARDGRTVLAVEPDAEYVEELRQRFAGRNDVEVVQSAAATIDPTLGPVDSIVCFNVLEHIADDAAALRRFRELLRPGGRLLLLVPAHPALFGEIDVSVGHERRYRKRELREKLDAAGLAIDVLRHVNPVGAAGWLVWSRILRRDVLPREPLRAYDRLVPLFRLLDRASPPFGLSLWAVARR